MAIDFASISHSALNIGILVITIVVVGAIMGLVTILTLKWRQYTQFKCVIFQRDGFGQWNERSDNAGIFIDKKTHNKRFFMRKNKVGLDPDNVPYIPSGNKKVVYLLQTGLKNFQFINIDLKTPSKVVLKVGEEDVNWAVNAYERQKKMLAQSLFMQLMPYMIIAFVSIIILVIFIYFFREFSTLKDMAELLHGMSENVAQAKSGTVVIPGGG